jgi:hypothetical protein
MYAQFKAQEQCPMPFLALTASTRRQLKREACQCAQTAKAGLFRAGGGIARAEQ